MTSSFHLAKTGFQFGSKQLRTRRVHVGLFEWVNLSHSLPDPLLHLASADGTGVGNSLPLAPRCSFPAEERQQVRERAQCPQAPQDQEPVV